jgi:diaminopropionate ammonia-lyase
VNQYVLNPLARSGEPNPGLFESSDYGLAKTFFRSRAEFRPTPLLHLRNLARQLGVGDILLKDESSRFGLNSFKVLGVTYAVSRLLDQGRLPRGAVLVCASEGNHGLAVAHVATKNKLKARIYLAADASPTRIDAIKREGAEVALVEGTYDDAVRQAIFDSERYGWNIISDTSWAGYQEIPRMIMTGYTSLLDEAEEQWAPELPPDIVLVQAGVGGLACAVLSWLCQRYGVRRPFVVVCEPSAAACVLESARAGKSVILSGPFNTIMVGLRCGEVSPLAWPVVATAADAFVAIDDEQCVASMEILAHPVNEDPFVPAGASGACGLAAFLALDQDESLSPVRTACGLNGKSRVLVINTESPQRI